MGWVLRALRQDAPKPPPGSLKGLNNLLLAMMRGPMGQGHALNQTSGRFDLGPVNTIRAA